MRPDCIVLLIVVDLRKLGISVLEIAFELLLGQCNVLEILYGQYHGYQLTGNRMLGMVFRKKPIDFSESTLNRRNFAVKRSLAKMFDVLQSSDLGILFFRSFDFADVDLVRQPGDSSAITE